MAKQAVWLAAAWFSTDMRSALALAPGCRIFATTLHIERPANSASVGRFQCLSYQLLGDIWTPTFALAFALAFTLGSGMAFGLCRGRLLGVLMLALVGVVGIGLWGRSGWSTCSQWKQMKTDIWTCQGGHQLLLER